MIIQRKITIIIIASVLIAISSAILIKKYIYPPNLLLQKPLTTTFTPQDRMEKDWRESGAHWFIADKVGKLGAILLDRKKDSRDFYFILDYTQQLPDQLTDAQKKMFTKKTKLINNKPIIFYSYKTGSMDPEKAASRIKNYYKIVELILSKKKQVPKGILAIPRGYFKKELSKPKKITVQQCADLLRGKTFLFYTGAGLSAAAGIPTGQQLKKQLFGFDTQKAVDQLAINILTNPQKIIDVQKQFEESFRVAKPTLAHNAMTKIALQHNAHIVTSNLDKLHEQAGIKSWFVMSKSFYDFLFFKIPQPISGNFAYLEANSQWLKNIAFVICVGMGTDVKGFMAWYKKNNPKGKIIGIDMYPVKYLGDEDYFLQGDAQVIIPQLEILLKE